MRIYSKAKEEFNILKNSYDKENEDEKPIILDYEKEVLAIVKKFGESGQSGGSAPITAYAISNIIRELLLQNSISSINGTEEEWVDQGDFYQNKRESALFRNKKGGQAYYLDAVVFEEPDGGRFTGRISNKICSSMYIKEFPFRPKTFYVKVKEKRNGKYKVIDKKQLKEALKYYDGFIGENK